MRSLDLLDTESEKGKVSRKLFAVEAGAAGAVSPFSCCSAVTRRSINEEFSFCASVIWAGLTPVWAARGRGFEIRGARSLLAPRNSI